MTGPSRRGFLVGTASAAVVILTGCGDDDSASSTTTSATTGDGTTSSTVGDDDFPRNDTEVLRQIFDPRFEPLGLKVTRAGLFDIEAGYERDDRGEHLALYVEPIDPGGAGWDEVRYIESVVPGVAASAPFIFATWPGVQTMDVCQEPPQAENPEPEPPIETQVVLSRADSSRIDWDTAELADLLAARLQSPDTVRVAARPGLENHPLWVAAEATAEDGA